YDKFYCVAERPKRKVIPTSVFVLSKVFFVLKLFDLSKSNRRCPIEQISSIYFYFTFPLISKLQLQQLSKKWIRN
ncbi:hypothetical protein ACUF4X_002563, partial [Acinetobacter baumannii]